MTLAVLTPFTAAEAVELAAQTWRKRLLPVGDIDYKGRTLRFTRDYLGRLVRSFNDRAYDQVALQLADAANTHTNDPERFRGEVTGMELGDDGLYVTVRTTEAGSRVLEENPRLGVSARIVEDYARADGRHFPAAVQHVLATLDPRITGLGPWQAVEASSPAPDTLVDLSNLSFAGEGAPPGASPPASPHVPAPQTRKAGMDLDEKQQARLAQLLSLPEDQFAALTAAERAPGDLGALAAEEPADALTDAELDELIAYAEQMDDAGLLGEEGSEEPRPAPNYAPPGDPQGTREPVAAGLSQEAQFAIDLANMRAEETQRELAVVTARLREEDYQAEKRRLADLGVPPFITELARPLLEGAGHAVELANGKTVDAGQVMRKVLGEYAAQARLLDLDVELGSPFDQPEGAGHEEAERHREDTVTRMKSAMGLK